LRECIGVLRSIGEELARVPPPKTDADFTRYADEAPTTVQWGLRTLSELYDHCHLSRLARAVIAGQSGDYGAPPSRVAAGLHAGLLHHYIAGGAYYPRGGGQVFAAHLVDVIRSHGGVVRTGARVDQILTKAGAVTGVGLTGGEILTASTVVSSADVKRTFLELLDRDDVSNETVEWIQQARMALPLFTVYLGLDIDLREHIPNTNYWCHGSSDAELMYQRAYDGELPDETFAYVTSASVKDPDTERIAPPGHTSLEVMTIVPPDYDFWGVTVGPAAGEKYRRKGHYRRIKDEIIERMVARIVELIPGLDNHIVWKEGATPITQERYTLSSGGACYGLELSADQIGPNRPPVTTEIERLYLAGASTAFGHGIAGVMSGGLGTASAVLGRDLMTEVSAGKVFGDPTLLTAGGPDWDPLEASKRLSAESGRATAFGNRLSG
jgi:all-trans-retinol 13,14-reductase